jgi:hypothetical protein
MLYTLTIELQGIEPLIWRRVAEGEALAALARRVHLWAVAVPIKMHIVSFEIEVVHEVAAAIGVAEMEMVGVPICISMRRGCMCRRRRRSSGRSRAGLGSGHARDGRHSNGDK